jgi:hypothetical protein
LLRFGLNDAPQTTHRLIGRKRRRLARNARMAHRSEHVLTMNRLRIASPQPSHARSRVEAASPVQSNHPVSSKATRLTASTLKRANEPGVTFAGCAWARRQQ